MRGDRVTAACTSCRLRAWLDMAVNRPLDHPAVFLATEQKKLDEGQKLTANWVKWIEVKRRRKTEVKLRKRVLMLETFVQSIEVLPLDSAATRSLERWWVTFRELKKHDFVQDWAHARDVPQRVHICCREGKGAVGATMPGVLNSSFMLAGMSR